MTVRINFLPRNYQPPKQLGVKEWGIAAAAALAIVATGAYYTSVYAGTADLEHQVSASQAKLQNVKTLLAQADEIKLREARITKAESDLKVLAGRHWSTTLLTLSQLTPQHVTWTSVKADGDNLVLKGTGRGLVDIAQLMGGLVTDTSVREVSLKVVTEKGIPITVTVKSNDKDPAKAGQDAIKDATKELGTIKQLEFEMVITLVPAEGREMPHGA
jgi:Tfp pilus assembly protein PilN